MLRFGKYLQNIFPVALWGVNEAWMEPKRLIFASFYDNDDNDDWTACWCSSSLKDESSRIVVLSPGDMDKMDFAKTNMITFIS